MSKLQKLIKYLSDPDYRFLVNVAHGAYHDMPDEEYLKRIFKINIGYELNLDNPKTYNEKIQWLKLHDRKPEYSKMVDKVEAKKYVASIIGDEYIIPTFGVWSRFEDIDFNALPDQFVLKCTHDSGGLIICRDKKNLDMSASRKKITSSLHRNFYYLFREWPYMNISPRIIAEQYMEDEFGTAIRDYKVLCFNGEPKLIELHQGRFTDHQTQDFYTTKWEKTNISQTGIPHFQVTMDTVPAPDTLDEMLELSRILAEGLPHIRVDWYSVSGKLYFGELTFYDGSGLDPWDNPEDDLMLGSWIELPKEREKSI